MDLRRVVIKLMDEKNREIWVGENRVYLDENNIINGIFIGDVDAKIANEICEAHLKLMNLVEGKVNILDDINRVGKPSSQARKILQGFIFHEKIGKVALFGLHPVARVLASFFIGVIKKGDIRFLKTKEEALAWLKE